MYGLGHDNVRTSAHPRGSTLGQDRLRTSLTEEDPQLGNLLRHLVIFCNRLAIPFENSSPDCTFACTRPTKNKMGWLTRSYCVLHCKVCCKV